MAAILVIAVLAICIVILFPNQSTVISTTMIALGLIGILNTVKLKRPVKRTFDVPTYNPKEFEAQIADVFRRYGYHVVETPYQGDHGVDLKVFKDNEYAVVQCKRYSGTVGEPIVRDFFGAMQHEGADHGFIITTGTFTRHAYQWSKGKRIVLVDGSALNKMFAETRNAEAVR